MTLGPQLMYEHYYKVSQTGISFLLSSLGTTVASYDGQVGQPLTALAVRS